MKKRPSIRFRLSAVAAVMLLLSLVLTMTGCPSSRPSSSDDPTIDGAVTIPPITPPDLTDNRKPTDTTPYAQRVESLFSENQPAPATDFTYEILEDGVRITGYIGGESVVIIPETVEDKPVTVIAERAFKGMGNLKAISVPDSVEVIGIGAFEGCKSLTSLRTPVYTCHTAPYFGALFGASSHDANGGAVPATLSMLVLTRGEQIPDYTFYACRGLEVVSLPETLTELGDFAFYGCQSLTYIPMAHTVLTTVGDHALANCAALLSLELPTSVQRLGAAMLEGCGKLETLTIPFVGGCTADTPLTAEEESAIETGDRLHPALETGYLGYLFGAASYTFTAGYLPASLIRVTLTEGCRDIPANAFFECASVREFILPEGVTSIGHRAFYGCESLATITVPSSVAHIGDDAFHGCIRLTEVSFADGDFPREVTLGVQTFMDCVSLRTVTLPAVVTHLPNSCFAGCISLETLTALGVETYGKQVFRHCDKLVGWEETTA